MTRLNPMMRQLFALMLCVCAGATFAVAQATTTSNPAMTYSANSESLTIGAGDLVTVHVFEDPTLTQTARITDAGTLPLILGGNVKLAGLTPEGASRVIEDALIRGQFILTPHVSVNVEQSATKGVTVIGQVKNPGLFLVGTNRSVLDVLALAGGLTELADHQVVVQRRGTGEKIVYTVSNDPSIALDTQPTVYPGDTVFVAKVYVVYMLGDVARPGGFPASTNTSKMTVLEALALAGGTPPTAVPAAARLVHHTQDGKYVEQNIQLSDMQKGKAPDIVMQPDDMVYVPYSYLRNVAVNLGQIVAAGASAVIYTH